MDSIVTVTVAASTYDLTTTAAVKTELGITVSTYDALITQWIHDESARIARYCGRVFPQETVSEAFRPDSRDRMVDSLILTRSPVISITTVTENTDAALDAAYYETAKPAGLLYRLCDDARVYWTAAKVVVVYVGGYATIPYDLASACMTLIKHRMSSQTRDPALRSITIDGVGQKQWWVGSSGDVGDMSPEVSETLDRYREIRL